MNTSQLYLKLILCTLTILFLSNCKKKDTLEPLIIEASGTPEGTALIITGAAARIGQEAALLEKLYKTGALDNLQLISGISAGGINTIALNGIIGGQYTWEEYKDLLFNLTNDSVFVNNNNNIPVDTRPLRKLFERLVNDDFGYQSFSDLPIPCEVTAVRLSDKKVIRIGNHTGLNGYGLSGDIVDGLMATTSIPGAMPAIRIKGEDYVDGGLKETAQYKSILEYQLLRGKPFEKIYVISFQRNECTDWSKELKALGLTGKPEHFLKKSLEMSGLDLDEGTRKHLLEDLHALQRNYPQMSSRTYVYMPKINDLPYYPLFEFSTEKSQFDFVGNWVTKNDPILLVDYLLSEN